MAESPTPFILSLSLSLSLSLALLSLSLILSHYIYPVSPSFLFSLCLIPEYTHVSTKIRIYRHTVTFNALYSIYPPVTRKHKTDLQNTF